MGYGRKRFALVALDGEFRVSAVAPLLTHLIRARKEAGASDLGLGLASMSGFNGTFKALQVTASASQWLVATLDKTGSQQHITRLMLRTTGVVTKTNVASFLQASRLVHPWQ